MGPSTSKDWNEYVVAAEAVARNPGFQELRDLILERAALQTTDVVLDLGAGTVFYRLKLPSVRSGFGHSTSAPGCAITS
jgi:hypothetical protein